MGLGTGSSNVYIPPADPQWEAEDQQRRAEIERQARQDSLNNQDAQGLAAARDASSLGAGGVKPNNNIMSDISNRGMNTFRASQLPINEGRFGWGRRMSDEANSWLQTLTERGHQADMRGMLAGPEAQQAHWQQQQARGLGMSGLDYMSGIVNRGGMTVAEQMANRGADRALQQQLAMAASVRGGGPAAAAAQQQAQAAGSAAYADMIGQGLVQGGMERQQLAGALAHGAAGMRGQDQAMINMGLQSRQLNDARSAGMLQTQMDIYKQQLLAQMEAERLTQQGHIAADEVNARINQFNAQQELNGGGAMPFFSGLMTGGMGSIL